MSWKPTDFFLTIQDFFGVLLPGAVGAAVTLRLLRDYEPARQFTELSGAAQWVAFGVVSLILGYLAYPPSHILNKAYSSIYRRWKRRKGDALLNYAKREAESRVPNISETGSVYEWAKTRVEAKDSSIGSRIQQIQGISKMFRTLSLFLLVGAVTFLFRRDWMLSAICLMTFIPSFLIFCERRFAATTLVYQRLMDLSEEYSKPSKILTL